MLLAARRPTSYSMVTCSASEGAIAARHPTAAATALLRLSNHMAVILRLARGQHKRQGTPLWLGVSPSRIRTRGVRSLGGIVGLSRQPRPTWMLRSKLRVRRHADIVTGANIRARSGVAEVRPHPVSRHQQQGISCGFPDGRVFSICARAPPACKGTPLNCGGRDAALNRDRASGRLQETHVEYGSWIHWVP